MVRGKVGERSRIEGPRIETERIAEKDSATDKQTTRQTNGRITS